MYKRIYNYVSARNRGAHLCYRQAPALLHPLAKPIAHLLAMAEKLCRSAVPAHTYHKKHNITLSYKQWAPGHKRLPR